MRYFVWAIPLLKAMFAWDVVVIFKSLVMTDIPKAFGSPKKAWHTIRCVPRSLTQPHQLILFPLHCQVPVVAEGLSRLQPSWPGNWPTTTLHLCQHSELLSCSST